MNGLYKIVDNLLLVLLIHNLGSGSIFTSLMLPLVYHVLVWVVFGRGLWQFRGEGRQKQRME